MELSHKYFMRLNFYFLNKSRNLATLDSYIFCPDKFCVLNLLSMVKEQEIEPFQSELSPFQKYWTVLCFSLFYIIASSFHLPRCLERRKNLAPNRIIEFMVQLNVKTTCIYKQLLKSASSISLLNGNPSCI